MWTFTVPGPPVPKGRPRLGLSGVYTPKRTKDYELKVAQYALAAGVRRAPAGQPMSLTLIAYLKRDGDIDNYCKSVLDALNGIAYCDDRQVHHLAALKRFDKLKPRMVVVVRWTEEE